VIKEQQNDWKRHRWQRIKTKMLKRGLDAQYDLVMKFPDRVHSWDVTLCLEETINEFMVFDRVSVLNHKLLLSLFHCFSNY